MGKAALLLGSNLGDRMAYLAQARTLIGELTGLIENTSSIYQTAPWGNLNQDDFLNQAILLDTDLSPDNLLTTLLDIETRLGRRRDEKWGPRTIDIDILYFDDSIVDTEALKLPHPYLHERRFSLVPLNDISPDWLHPVLKKTVHEMLNACPDGGEVTLFSKDSGHGI